MAEGVGLENRYTRKGIVGSNPTLSAVPPSAPQLFFCQFGHEAQLLSALRLAVPQVLCPFRKLDPEYVMTLAAEQATPGENPGLAGGGNNSRQDGLINVSLGDVAILNDVNVAVAANVLVTVCGLDINAAILAAQAVGDVSETVCNTTAGPLEIVQS